MAKFASFDPSIAAPSPITGWYDADNVDYADMPPAASLLTLTAEQWANRQAGLWAVSNGTLVAYARPAPILTLGQQAAAIAATGVAVVSAGTPSLNGTYAIDGAAQGRMAAVSVYILVNSRFPGGASVQPWLDVNGVVHVFSSTTEFQAFASAIADYVAALDLVAATNAGSLPATPLSIP